VQEAVGAEAASDRWLVVHARTRDFRYGCRVGRARLAVLREPTLRFLAAEAVAEVEQRLAELAVASSASRSVDPFT
jgi:hypothetical protein